MIAKAFARVSKRLVGDPKPKLWEVMNPKEAIWDNQPAVFELADAGRLDRNRSFFYVHGFTYDGSAQSAFNDFYAFDRAVEWWKPNKHIGGCSYYNAMRCRLFILAYRTSFEVGFEAIVRSALSSVLGGVTGSSPVMAAAVYWREFERRAQVTGEFLARIIAQFPQDPDGLDYHIFSQSLGCYTVASAGQRLYGGRTDGGGTTSQRGPFRSWYCMAGALPNDAFGPLGAFKAAPYLTEGEAGLSVYYSMVDDTLSTLYYIANGFMAMGQIGSTSETRVPTILRNVDTFKQTGNTHAPVFGYFEKVAPLVRRNFGFNF